MKISNSKKQLAKIISENGGWREEAEFSVQDRAGDIFFYETTPVRSPVEGEWKPNGIAVDDWIETSRALPNWHQTILSRDEYFHLYPAPDADGWIEWSGGECPVEKDVLVVLKMRGGYLWKDGDPKMAGRMGWEHDNDDSDIIAYRLHKPEITPDQQEPKPAPIPEVKLTIEQLAADYRAKLAIAQQAQEEADSHRCGAEAALEKLVATGKALGLALSVAAPEPELVITEWRDLRVGDEIEVFDFDSPDDGSSRKEELMRGVCVVMRTGACVHIELKSNLPKEMGYWNAQGIDKCKFRFIRRP